MFPELMGNLIHFFNNEFLVTCTFGDVALISDVVLLCLMVILLYMEELTSLLLHSF